jgi:hypothetical protein
MGRGGLGRYWRGIALLGVFALLGGPGLGAAEGTASAATADTLSIAR